MVGEEASYGGEQMRQSVKDYLKLGIFEEFFENLKNEKLAGGDLAWSDTLSPQVV